MDTQMFKNDYTVQASIVAGPTSPANGRSWSAA